jgi:hypothetical protein
MKIGLAEVIAGLEEQKVDKITALWTVAAFVANSSTYGGVTWCDVEAARKTAEDMWCQSGYAAVMRHVDALPASLRGFVQA